MSSPLTKKKFALSLLLIAVVLAGVFGMGHGVFAQQQQQPPAAQPQAGNAIDQIFGSTGWVWGALLAVLVIVQKLFALLVALSSIFLNTMFKATIDLVPSLNQTVQVGWIVLRDFVNGIFILLVLWIALTIILGIEQFGGKKLLAKVLAVAILINFSLAIVTAMVVLSNQFAHAFYDKIDAGVQGDIAGYIIGITKIQTTTNTLTPEQITKLAADARAKQEATGQLPTSYTRDGMLASIGFYSASAETCAAASQRCQQEICVVKYGDTGGCNTPDRRLELNACNRAAQQAQCTGPVFAKERDAITSAANGISAVSNFITAGQKKIGDWNMTTFEEVGNAIIAVILLAIVTTTFLYAAVALGIRYFAIIFLTIASPVAFLTVALPMNLGKSEGWDYWWKEFMKWIFFAPAFYFLIYLTLIMAQQMHAAFSVAPGLSSIRNDPKLILGLFIVMGLLIYASRLAKKTSGKMGEFTVGLAKKAGGLALGVTAGVATGGTLMAARAVARGAAKEGGVAEKMASSRFGRIVGGGVLLRKGVQEREAQKGRIAEREKKYEHYSTSQMQAEVRGSSLIYSEENAARIAALAKKKDGFKGVSDTEMRTYENILSRYNQASVIAKVKPTMANEKTVGETGRRKIAETGYGAPVLGINPSNELKAVQYTGENLSGKEIDDTLDVNELAGDDPKNKALRAGIIRNTNLTQKRIEDLVQKNYSAAAKVVADMKEFVDQLDTQINDVDKQIAAGGTTQEIAALNVKKSDLQRQRAPKQAILNNLRTTPGGRALGLAAPALELTGSRVITGSRDSLTVDVKSRIRGGSGRYTFAFLAPVPGFQIDPSGILSTDPGARPPAGSRHSITVQVTDAADPTHPMPITLNAVINP